MLVIPQRAVNDILKNEGTDTREERTIGKLPSINQWYKALCC